MFCEHFGAKPCQNHGEPQETQIFGAKTREGTTKTKNKTLEHWVDLQQDAKTLFPFVLFGPSSVLPPNLSFFGTLQGFGKVLLQNAPKTLWGPKKTKFWTQNTGGYQKKKKIKFWSIGFGSSRRQNFVFWFFWYPPTFWHQNFGFFVTSRVLAGFCSKMLPKPCGVQKKQSFGHKTQEGTRKNKKNQSFGVLGLAAQDAKTLFFWSFWYPPAFWHQNFGFFVPSRVLARFCSKMLPKPCGVPKKQSFGAKRGSVPEKTKKNKVLEYWVWQLKTPKLCFLVFLVPSNVLAPKLWFFCNLQGFGRVLLQNAPKTLWGPKKTKFWCQNVGGYQKKTKNKNLEHWVVWQLKTPKHGFLLFFFGPSSVLPPNLSFFVTLHGFGKVLLQNAPKSLWGPQKPKFWTQNAGGYQKKQKHQSFGVLGLAAQDAKTLFFWSFWYPPAFWHQNFCFCWYRPGFW